MKRYKSVIKEQEIESYEIDPKVKEILEILRDNNYGNESSRKEMLSLLSTLHTKRDRVARKVFKQLGNLFNTLSDELISGV